MEEKKSFFFLFFYLPKCCRYLLCWLNFFILFYFILLFFSFSFEEERKERNISKKGGKKSNFFGVCSSSYSFRYEGRKKNLCKEVTAEKKMNCLNLMMLGMYEEFCVYFDAALRAESKQQRFCLLCSINDLDREGLSNHNSSWWSVRWMDGRFMLFLLSKFFLFFSI